MDEPFGAPWPQPSQRLRELFRAAAAAMQEHSARIAHEMWSAGQRNLRDSQLANDPVLSAIDQLHTTSMLTHWLAANIDDPGCRANTVMIAEARHYAREVLLRGLDEDYVDAWRAVQQAGWQAWLQFCFEATDDKESLRELVEASSSSWATFIDDNRDALSEYLAEVRLELSQGSAVERLATVQLLLRGAEIAQPRAEAQLGYALTGRHMAAILWADSYDQLADLEKAAERVKRAAGAAHRLTLVAGTATFWMWLPASSAPTQADLDQISTEIPGVRIALGRPALDVRGFRRSHLDAASVKRMLTSLQSSRRAVRFQDVQLVCLLTDDIAEVRQFVADTLGELATADQALRQTVRVLIAEQFNISKAAERLFAHRNTIDRRLARVDNLLPRPLAQNLAEVDTALALVELLTDE